MANKSNKTRSKQSKQNPSIADSFNRLSTPIKALIVGALALLLIVAGSFIYFQKQKSDFIAQADGWREFGKSNGIAAWGCKTGGFGVYSWKVIFVKDTPGIPKTSVSVDEANRTEQIAWYGYVSAMSGSALGDGSHIKVGADPNPYDKSPGSAIGNGWRVKDLYDCPPVYQNAPGMRNSRI